MHRLSLFSPAGLADGLALKESRYLQLGLNLSRCPRVCSIRPWPDGQLVPPRPFAGRGFGLDRRGHASSTAHGPDGKSAASCASFRNALLASDLRHVGRDLLRVVALEQALRHAVLAGASALDRVQHALLVERGELVEVGAGDAVRLDRGKGVAALAGFDEDGLALLHARAGLLGAQRADGPDRLAPGGDHCGRYGY